MKYFCLDFETANSRAGDICSVGIICVENEEIQHTFYSLVNPETDFDPFCTYIHGITENDVVSAPKISDIVAQIEPIILHYENLVAHYSAFDVRHLVGAYGRAARPLPEIPGIYCTRSISLRAFPGRISYSLHQLTDVFSCDYEAHNAAGDALACHALLRSCLQKTGTANLNDLCNVLKIRPGHIHNCEYAPCLVKTPAKKPLAVTRTASELDETHPFFGREVVFTGTLTSMRRADAAQLVVNCGGIFSDTLRKTTNFLVLGMQDALKLNGNEKSAKVQKAEKLLAQGADIQVVGENEFLMLLNNRTA